MGEGGVKNLKKWVTSLMDGHKRVIQDPYNISSHTHRFQSDIDQNARNHIFFKNNFFFIIILDYCK